MKVLKVWFVKLRAWFVFTNSGGAIRVKVFIPTGSYKRATLHKNIVFHALLACFKYIMKVVIGCWKEVVSHGKFAG